MSKQVLGREVYTSNNQLGGVQIMHYNGISHITVPDDFEGVCTILEWLSYMPKVQYPLRSFESGRCDRVHLLGNPGVWGAESSAAMAEGNFSLLLPLSLSDTQPRTSCSLLCFYIVRMLSTGPLGRGDRLSSEVTLNGRESWSFAARLDLIPGFLLPGSETLGQSLNLSEPQFPHL